MGTPASEQFTPTPHQRLTAMEFIDRVAAQHNYDNPVTAPEFWIGMRDGYKCHYGGKFWWNTSSKSLVATGRTILGYPTEEWRTDYKLQYSPGPRRSIVGVKDAECLVFALGNEKQIAYWNKDLQQWILGELFNFD